MRDKVFTLSHIRCYLVALILGFTTRIVCVSYTRAVPREVGYVQQTDEQAPSNATRVYPLPPQIENRLRVEDIPKRPPRVDFTDGSDDVGMPQQDRGTNHSWQPAFALGVGGLSGALVGSFFGIPGVLVGAVAGTALAVLNERSKAKRLH